MRVPSIDLPVVYSTSIASCNELYASQRYRTHRAKLWARCGAYILTTQLVAQLTGTLLAVGWERQSQG